MSIDKLVCGVSTAGKLITNVNELVDETVRLEAEREALATQDLANKARLTDAENNLASLNVDNSASKGRLTTAEGEIDTLQVDNVSNKGRLTATEGEVATLDNQVTNLETDNTNNKGRLTTVESEIDALQLKSDSNENRVGIVEGDISSLEDSVAAVDSKADNIAGRTTTAEQGINSLKSDNTNNKSRLTTIEADITNIEGELSGGALYDAINKALDYSSTVWDSVSDVATGDGITTGVTRTHENMKRCLLLDDGTVNYYLDPNNSNLKADGSDSVLTGEDGQVMVEIPKCYVRTYKLGNQVVWSVSSEPRYGYVLHPAFTKDGTLQYDNKLDMWYYVGVAQEVDYVYVGAYQASVYDTSGATYIDGLNSDNNSSRVELGADKLSSVAGRYPMVGLVRSEFRTLANNRGTGWNEIDFWTHSLLQLLYTTEYRDLNSQSAVSQGVVSVTGGYPASSDLQTDSPHSVAGKSNAVGNQSGGVDSTVRDVPWMSYRGIENFWGNCYVWVDGVNILDQVYHVNNTGTFTDNTTSSGYIQLGLQAPSDNGYIRNVQSNTLGFVPASVAGGSSNIAFSDYYYQAAGYRVMRVGGLANGGANAGAFVLSASSSSGFRNRSFGARVVYK